MHPIQDRLLQLSKRENLARLTLRDIAKLIGLAGESPQKIKHHLVQLETRGFITIDRDRGVMKRAPATPGWAVGLLRGSPKLFSLPIVGTANCGPTTIFAEQNIEGYLRVSSSLVGRTQPMGLYVIAAKGSSMNRASVNGKSIDDGDYVVVDGRKRGPKPGDVVVAIIDNQATIKEFVDDRANGQVVLRANSSSAYAPIFLHEDDDFTVSGIVVAVVKTPS